MPMTTMGIIVGRTLIPGKLAIFLFASLSGSAMAQSKADLTNAILNQRAGKLDIAKSDIDKAVLSEKLS